MTDETPIWRQALKDDQHPLHRAAWILFSEKFNPQYADRVLVDLKPLVIQFIYLILDTEELYWEESLGSGNAPINGLDLLGRWQVVEAIPRLIRLLEETEWDAIAHDRAALALEEMGPEAVDPLLEYAAHVDEDEQVSVASMLAKVGKGLPHIYDHVKKVFERQKDEWDVAYMAECLLTFDPQQAIPFLEEWLSKHKYSKDLKTRLEKYIVDATAGNFP